MTRYSHWDVADVPSNKYKRVSAKKSFIPTFEPVSDVYDCASQKINIKCFNYKSNYIVTSASYYMCQRINKCCKV